MEPFIGTHSLVCYVWFVILVIIIQYFGIASGQDYSRHGLFWGGSLSLNAGINQNGIWQGIPGANLIVSLNSDKQTIISYEIAAEGLRNLEGNPLPRESNTDSLQIRCLVDGTPLRHSSSVATTYLVEQRMIFTLSSTFAVNMTSDQHNITLQWKKSGNQLDEWIIQTGGVNSKFTMSAQADFDSIYYSHETKDEFLYTQDVWKPLSDNIPFYIDKERIVTIGYSFVVQPQLLSFIKDRTMEYIMSRISVDGTSFLESGETFGTNGWNPSSHVMKGIVRLKLQAGTHTAQLMWRKRGNIFKSWGSNPSSMDGFASSRNVYILTEKFDSPVFIDHERQITPSSGQWSTVGGSKNILTFQLYKESAVLLTYALPVSQYENPNFDSNIWDSLAKVDARLVVDDVAYTFQGGDTVRKGAREFTNLFGNLALVLPAGTHVMYLQWRSDGFRWTTLNDMDGGFAHGERLLAYISSENSRPVITSPVEVYGIEDHLLVISNIRVDDIDDQMAGGIMLDVNITVHTGLINMPNAALLALPVEYIFGTNETIIHMNDNIANINAALLNLTYTPPATWFGEDTLTISISDQYSTGYGSTPLTDEAKIRIVIASVDNMFTLSYSSYQKLPNIGTNQQLDPILLTDIDSQSDEFRVQLSATCGVISLDLASLTSTENIIFYLSDGVNDTFVDFQALFPIVQSLLIKLHYSPSSSCNHAVHQESIVLRVTDASNPTHDLTRLLSIETIRENAAPEILGQTHPRWKLDGLRLQSTVDTTEARVNYTQYPVKIESSLDWKETTATASNYQEISSLSELSVFATPHTDYALSIQYGHPLTVTMLSSNYIQLNTNKIVHVSVMDGLPQNTTSVLCIFDGISFPAELDMKTTRISCNITLTSANPHRMEWLNILTLDETGLTIAESNYLPMFIAPVLELISIYPREIISNSKIIIKVQTNNPGVVTTCLYNNISTVAIIQSGEVLCQIPVFRDILQDQMVDFRIASEDGHFLSNSIELIVLPNHTIEKAYIVENILTSMSFLVIQGNWTHSAVDITENIQCQLSNGIVLPAATVTTTEVYCTMERNTQLTENTTVVLLFDQSSSNNIHIIQPESMKTTPTIETSTTYQLYDTFTESKSEENFLTLLGDFAHLQSGKGLVCHFGTKSSVVVWVDEFTLLCSIPSNSSGAFSLGSQLIMEEFNSNIGSLKVPMIVEVQPSAGSVAGGQKVIVTGSGFTSSSSLQCRIGRVITPALYLSESTVQCTTPPHSVGQTEIHVIVDDIYSITTQPLYFTYTSQPTVHSVYPSAGLLQGETQVEVFGRGFGGSTADATCMFGNASVSGIVVSDGVITCTSPASQHEGYVSLSVILDTHEASIGAVSFLYLSPMVLTSMVPRRGPSVGGNKVSICGVGFAAGTTTFCTFGVNSLPARVINTSVIECDVPGTVTTGLVPIAISVDGFIVESGLEYMYEVTSRTESMTPLVGPPQGGTSVMIKGVGFSRVSVLTCRFGSIEVPASRVSDTFVACVTPAQSMSTVDVTVIVDGVAASSITPLHFMYVKTPVVDDIFPAAGPVAGGTIVTVHGSGFSTPSTGLSGWEVLCQFGSKLSVAAVQSDSSLTCLAPAGDHFGYEKFSVVVSGFQETTATPVRFLYLDPVVITSLSKSRGSTAGEEHIIVSAISLPESAQIECIFGERSVPATYLNMNAVECVTPAAEAGMVSVGLSIEGYEIAGENLKFSFESPILLSKLVPAVGSIYGDANVTITASGLALNIELVCLWDSVPHPAVVVSEHEVMCISPAHAAGVVRVAVAEAELSTAPQSFLEFEYVSQPVIYSISPSAGLVDGGMEVTVSGAHFPMDSSLTCQFDNTTVSATVLSTSTIICLSPPRLAPGVVPVSIRWANVQKAATGEASFRYLKTAVVTDLYPAKLPVNTSNPLILVGPSFPVGTEAICSIDEIKFRGRILNATAAECDVVMDTIGAFPVTLSVDGFAFSSTQHVMVEFVQPGRVTGMDVTQGAVTGGTNITLSGDGFDFTADSICLFGDIAVPAVVMSQSVILCTSPPRASGDVLVTLLIDNVAAMSDISMVFKYTSTVQVKSIAPRAGLRTGGELIYIHGSGFEVTDIKLYCRFGSLRSTANVLSDDLLTCTTPPQSISTEALIEVAVLTSGGDESVGAQFFRYVSLPQLTALHPERGSPQGNDVVLVRGASLPSTGELWCVFGPSKSKAAFINSTAIQCISPPNTVSVVDVAIVVDDYILNSSALTFTYAAPVTLSHITPSVGGLLGSTKVTVAGTGFPSSGEVMCWFGTRSTPAFVVSSTVVECFTPAHPAEQVEFMLTVEGVLAEYASPVLFQFMAAPIIATIHPIGGVLAGGTIVNVSGKGFSSLVDEELFCAFGSDLSLATVISDSVVQCSNPLSTTSGVVAVVLQAHNQTISTGSVHFRYLAPIVLDNVRPSYSFSTGGETILLRGAGFAPVQDVACWFGSTAAPAMVLNESAVECTVPADMPIDVTGVDVSIAGMKSLNGPLHFVLITPWVIDSISTSVGSTVGGERVLLEGTGFISQVDFYCVFGNVKAPGSYINETMLACDSISHAPGTVNLTVQVGQSSADSTALHTFNFVEGPLITKLFPATGTIVNGTAIEITGRNLLITTSSLTCRLNGIVVDVVVLTAESALCPVITMEASVHTSVSVEVAHGDQVLFTSQYDLGSRSAVANYGVIRPHLFAIDHPAVAHIVGGPFYPSLLYQCKLDDDLVMTAVVLSENQISCFLPAISTIQHAKLTITNDHLGIVASFEVSFLAQPTITSAVVSRLNSEILLLTLDKLDPSMLWTCSVDDVQHDALAISSTEVACYAPEHSATAMISISAVKSGFYSNKIVLSNDTNNQDYTGTTASMLCPQISDISAFRNDATSVFAAKCVPFNNSTMSASQRHLIDRKVWFAKSFDFPPREIEPLEVDYSQYPGVEQSIEITSVYGDMLPDTASSACVVNSNTSCFSTSLEAVSAVLDVAEFNQSTETGQYLPSTEDFIVLHTVEPKVVDSANGSWVTVTGRGFTPHSVCKVDNTTTFTTTFISPLTIQCYIENLDQTRRLFLDLQVSDLSGAVSVNTLPVVYNFLTKTQHKRFRAARVPSMYIPDVTSIGTRYTTGGTFCASKYGCEVPLPMSILNTTWTAFLDATSFGMQNMSYSSNYSSSNELMGKRQRILESFDNLTAMVLNSSSTAKIIEHIDEENVPTVLFFSPVSFDLSLNSTTDVIQFLGRSLNPIDEWCVSVKQVKETCFAQSSTSLICNLPNQLAPGSAEVNVLRHCNESVFTGSIELFYSSNHAKIGDVSTQPILNMSTWQQSRGIATVKPLSGSMHGLTAILVAGIDLADVHSCSFRFTGSNSYSSPVEIYTSEGVICLTPSVSHIGAAEIELNLRQGSTISTGVYFNFFGDPEVTYISTGSENADELITVYGHRFPTSVESYCNVTFTSGASMLTAAQTVSSEMLTCIGAYRDVFHGRVLEHVSVSFNGQDFIQAHGAALLTSHKSTRSAVSLVSGLELEELSPLDSSARQMYLSNAFAVNTLELTYSCDKSNSIVLNVPGIKQTQQSNCTIDGVWSGAAQYLAGNQMRCQFPIKPPGVYQLAIDHKADTLLLPTVAMVTCLPSPKLLSAVLLPQNPVSGATELHFKGLNFHSSLQVQCRVETEWKVATVNSAYEVTCIFEALVPGVKTIALELNGRVLGSYTQCISIDLLADGGTLQNIAHPQCSDAELVLRPIQPVIQLPVRNREIRSFSPRSGLTIGNTPVEIIADGINFGTTLSCKFGNILVDALVVDLSKAVCYTPPQTPQNTTLSLVSADGQQTWCCGWFFYHPVVKALSVSPSIIDRQGGSILMIELQTQLPVTERLYCHVSSQVLFANRIGNTSVSCITPAILVSSVVSVSVGSQREVWSNSLEVGVSDMLTESIIIPARGSLEGGTAVQIRARKSAQNMMAPSCLFNYIPAVAAHWSDIEKTSITCVTPPGVVGPAEVYITDTTDERSPEFFAGIYTFEIPAAISAITPTFVNQGQMTEITVFGANFHDSPELSCVLNTSTFVPARWLSSQVIMCSINETYTISGHDLYIQITNNQVDISTDVVVLQVKHNNMILNISPLTGFTTGGTEITVQFRTDYHGNLRCRFQGTVSVPAYPVDTTTYACTAPAIDAEEVILEVVDTGNYVLAEEKFHFLPVPVIRATQTAPAILSGTPSEFTLQAVDLSPGVVGRFQSAEASVVEGICRVSENSLEELHCTGVLAPHTTSLLFLDLSVNGVDFIDNFATIQVYEPSNVVLVDPLFASEAGGNLLHFTVDSFRSGFVTNCRFMIEDAVIESPAVLTGERTGTCVTPALPLGAVVTWNILQSERSIYGPVEVVVVPMPTVSAVSPLVVPTGVLSIVHITFLTPVYDFPAISCMFQGTPYALKRLNATMSACAVMPTEVGEATLAFRYQGLRDQSLPIGVLSVTPRVADITIGNRFVTSFAKTNVTMTSPSCMMPESAYCKGIGVELTTVLVTSCEVICSVLLTQNKAMIRLDVCNTDLCLQPLFSSPITVLPSMSVVALSPASGPVQGGQQVLLYGSGFEQDATLMCMFGDQSVPMTVLSTTRALCITPHSPPGPAPVSIQRRGLVVSSSTAVFQFIPLLSSMDISTTSISSLGGTAVMVFTQDLHSTGPYYCRFNDKFVPALVNSISMLVCQSPSFDASEVTFALSVDSADVSVERVLEVWSPPAVLMVDPENFPADKATTVSIFVEDNGSLESVQCKLDGVVVTTTLEDSAIIYCEIPDTVAEGEHVLSLVMEEVEFFQLLVHARPSFSIVSVSPLVSFSTFSTAISLKVTEHMTGAEFSRCCFGDTQTPATLISSTEWQCYTPITQFSDLQQRHLVPVGLARSEGFCEYFGFQFTFIHFPTALSVSASNGSVAGGSAVVLIFAQPVELNTVYCRVGLVVTMGQIVDNTIQCVTTASPPGVASIELSTNGIDFMPTAYKFEYLPVVPSLEEVSLPVVQPVVYFLEPRVVSTMSQGTITVRGAGFRPGVVCLLGASDSTVPLLTRLVTEGEIQCILPVHSPGTDVVSVKNIGSAATAGLTVEFVMDPSLSSHPQTTLEPTFGSKRTETFITIYGQNLAIAGTDLLCLIGEDWSYAVDVTNTSLKCIAPASQFSGKVPVRVGYSDRRFIAGSGLFEYIEDPVLFDAQPARASRGSDLLVTGVGFLRSPTLTCMLGDVAVPTTVLSNTRIVCKVPELSAGQHSVTLSTNGQHFVRSGLSFEFLEQVALEYLWPLNGPALRGGTILSVHGTGFVDNIDMYCMVDVTLVPAIVLSNTEVQCRLPPHKPGLVNVSLLADGALLHPLERNLQFLYTPDVSVDKITPEFGYTSGDYPVFVFGSNFINTTGLGCRFADMKSRGLFLSPVSIVCLSPSPLGRPLLANLDSIAVEVTVNGLDYSESGVTFAYSEPCDQGFFCAGSGRSLCPNGTYCPLNSRNFTLCAPGFFQPREGQTGCVICPVGYICPDQGMSRPINCPPGLICDAMGLRSSAKLCPNGHYCLNNTKSSTVNDFAGTAEWVRDNVTGVMSFDESSTQYDYVDWPYPAVGRSRPSHPPEFQCDGLVCSGGTTNVLAEAPFPCPIGHYCRAGVGTQIPMPKNFSSPQRCYDGFFCPRGSVSPEGQGPCPNGYFCPTQLDAIVCPQGHYCPGVGNTAPVECYPGTYNPFEGQGNCTVCPTGYICPSWGTLLPEPCPAGFVCMALGLSYPVVLCPAGYRCAEGTLTMDPSATTKKKPQVCREAEFCLGGVASTLNIEWISTQPWGASQPQVCSEGTYCQAGAYLSSGSGLCFQGHYCPPNTSFPIETPLGNFASGLGSVAPTLCYPGTYAPLTAQVDCLTCPSGHTCISYGTYIPTICLEGTYRSQVDSVTCTQCPTATYSYEVGGTDLTVCLPCPKGRICGIKKMLNLTQSSECPAGYICGYGTDRSSQFAHLTPAGFHTVPNTIPENQYSSPCQPGFYCPRGTPTYSQFAGKCPVGSYCPLSTPAAVNADTKCPAYTTSLSQAETVQNCRIAEVNVCDKLLIDDTEPMEDLTYYATFSYDLLDDSGASIDFDSSTSATNPTGEIQVVRKIHPTNLTSSSPLWSNDTVEAFRSCPQYGSAEGGGEPIMIIGRNFKDTKLNYCRFRACYSANLGRHPRRCQNQITAPTGEDLRRAGNVSETSIVVRAKYLSPTRIECEVPEFIFDIEDINYSPDPEVTGYSCHYINYQGNYQMNATNGNYSYVRQCDSTNLNCANQPETGLEYFSSLTFRCTAADILDGLCANKPELFYMFNPCMSAEVMVEVTNDGEHYSSGEDLEPYSVLSTVRHLDYTKKMYTDFKNFTFLSTFAVYTYVFPNYMYKNPAIMDMERLYCVQPRYSEEDEREREKGYFQLKLNEVGHVQVDLSHLPDNMVYDQHYRIAVFIIPSRCTVELCSSARVRLSPEEYVPCRKPVDFSYWFQQTDVPKNVKNNITIFALDDLIFKVEIHILHGLYASYAPLFDNTTTVRIASPQRTRTDTGTTLKKTPTRQLSKYISYEERKVPMQFFYVAVYYADDVNSISQALNMPPLYKDYERGRALIMNNRSSLNNEVPLILDDYADVNIGTSFWLMPATTSDESKEMLDVYFETFHETTYGEVEGYVFNLQQLALPYLPYFSNCDTFDSYIPIWLLLEGEECELPDIYPKSWNRYKFPALPDLDDIKVVGPFSFFEDPIADWCERTVVCHYEEQLDGQDNTPRWFEAETGTSLFQIIRTPFNYYQYTGRSQTGVSQDDSGGGAAISTLQQESGDNFIEVVVDHSIGDLIAGCTVQCFARSYLLEITYFQETLHTKRIVSAQLIGDLYDFNQEDTTYELQVSYYALGFYDLVLNFAYPLSIFMVIFVFLGFLTVFVSFLGWAVCRLTTVLQNPPQIKIMSMLVLVVPPPLAGVTMGVTGVWLLTSLGNWFINGELITDPNSPTIQPMGTQRLDSYPLAYGDLGTIISEDEMERARTGRIGSVFMIVGFCCFVAASKMYFPKEETKREHEVAKMRTELAQKELWNPIQWKKANFMFCSFVFASLLVLVVEFSYSDVFEEGIYEIIVMLIIFGEVFKEVLDWQLNDAILVAPLNCGWNFVSQLVTFGSPDFLAFLLSYFLGVAMQIFQRVFQKVYVDAIFSAGQAALDFGIVIIKRILPKYMNTKGSNTKQVDTMESKDYRRREVDGVQETAEESDSVEPILEYFGDVCSDMMILVYFPFFVYLLMQYREQVQIPIIYGIRQSDMMIYMVFQLFVLFAQPFADIFHHSMCELFHGWKIYEYLVYSRYRFLQRETRWKSMENSLDECIEEGLRRLDQMCFSSQYYLMLTIQVNGIIYVVFAYECWLRSGYSPFTDSAFFMLLAFLVAMFLLLKWIALTLAIRLKLWKIKHENTAWHMAQREEDDLDIPAWDEIKGASTDAYLMNQRITSETFRYKFLNYNRTWLINQLPQLLTPRTLRRSRPYLINQFARIINARRDDISDDSDADKDRKFGPVALTAPSRNIVRWWLGKARRRIKLRGVVEPLIKRARGSQCEQCLSRKQLQIEYEIDVDKMAEMYDRTYPGDEEVDQVQWKQFWINNQRYHTICLACLTRRKEIEAREAMKGVVDPSLFDDGQEEYPDWGPVFLTAASKAMLLNWYRKAQRLRAGKRGNKRKEKVVKAISDDEGEDLPKEWLRDMPNITAATKAIAVKWMRTARARLQKKHGKGAGLRESERDAEEKGAAGETFRSGRKSRTLRK